MRKTPLHNECERLGGKIVDFHGWALPVQFAGIIQEHKHTRSHASIFDCSHMGEFSIKGSNAVTRYHNTVMSNVEGLKVGRVRYGALLNEDGGIIDDITTYRVSDDELYVVTNAGPREKVSSILTALDSGVQDVSDATAKIDVQGPKARDVLLQIGVDAAGELKYFGHCKTEWNGAEFLLSRTGYTGELGYEMYVPNELAVPLWKAIVELEGVEPAGLGARDTLRTEVGYGLSGQDFDESRTPLEAGMAPFIAWKTEFTGKAALEKLKDKGGYNVLTAIKTEGRRAPRHDFEVKRDGAVIGEVTSGTFGPTVGHGIGLAYLPEDATEPGTKLTCGPRDMEIEVATLPFYTQGTCRD